MRCRSLAVSVLVAAVASLPLAASATLIEVTSVTRSVTASADQGGPGFDGVLNSNTTTSSSGAGLIQAFAFSQNPSFPLEGTHASNQQTSTILADGIVTSGSGNAYASEFMFGYGTYSLESVYDITLQVTAPSSFDFTGLASAGYPTFSVSAKLFDPDGVAIFDQTRSGSAPEPFSATGSVDPGLHRFLVTLTRTGNTTESVSGYTLSARLNFTLIPEPSTGLLVIVGLLGFAGWRTARA